jgi:hypothetical protein
LESSKLDSFEEAVLKAHNENLLWCYSVAVPLEFDDANVFNHDLPFSEKNIGKTMDAIMANADAVRLLVDRTTNTRTIIGEENVDGVIDLLTRFKNNNRTFAVSKFLKKATHEYERDMPRFRDIIHNISRAYDSSSNRQWDGEKPLSRGEGFAMIWHPKVDGNGNISFGFYGIKPSSFGAKSPSWFKVVGTVAFRSLWKDVLQKYQKGAEIASSAKINEINKRLVGSDNFFMRGMAINGKTTCEVYYKAHPSQGDFSCTWFPTDIDLFNFGINNISETEKLCYPFLTDEMKKTMLSVKQKHDAQKALEEL